MTGTAQGTSLGIHEKGKQIEKASSEGPLNVSLADCPAISFVFVLHSESNEIGIERVRARE